MRSAGYTRYGYRVRRRKRIDSLKNPLSENWDAICLFGSARGPSRNPCRKGRRKYPSASTGSSVSFGHITRSASVIVFGGATLPWIAAVPHAALGGEDEVVVRSGLRK
jgi:hypothetical protein